MEFFGLDFQGWRISVKLTLLNGLEEYDLKEEKVSVFMAGCFCSLTFLWPKTLALDLCVRLNFLW